MATFEYNALTSAGRLMKGTAARTYPSITLGTGFVRGKQDRFLGCAFGMTNLAGL